MAHRNRWFTVLNSMVDLSMAMLLITSWYCWNTSWGGTLDVNVWPDEVIAVSLTMQPLMGVIAWPPLQTHAHRNGTVVGAKMTKCPILGWDSFACHVSLLFNINMGPGNHSTSKLFHITSHHIKSSCIISYVMCHVPYVIYHACICLYHISWIIYYCNIMYYIYMCASCTIAFCVCHAQPFFRMFHRFRTLQRGWSASGTPSCRLKLSAWEPCRGCRRGWNFGLRKWGKWGKCGMGRAFWVNGKLGFMTC